MEKLDLENVRVYTEEDVINAMSLIGQDVYSSNYKDFSVYSKNEFIGVNYVIANQFSTLQPFICQNKDGNERDSFRYLILAKDVKFKEEEKKLRPYKDVEELFMVNGLALGKVIRYREKDSDREYVIVLNSYTSDDLVMISGGYRTLQELFNYYEYYDNVTSEWKPFGVEE